MESLAGYQDSDDSQEMRAAYVAFGVLKKRQTDDTNYDAVQMDCSEESDSDIDHRIQKCASERDSEGQTKNFSSEGSSIKKYSEKEIIEYDSKSKQKSTSKDATNRDRNRENSRCKSRDREKDRDHYKNRERVHEKSKDRSKNIGEKKTQRDDRTRERDDRSRDLDYHRDKRYDREKNREVNMDRGRENNRRRSHKDKIDKDRERHQRERSGYREVSPYHNRRYRSKSPKEKRSRKRGLTRSRSRERGSKGNHSIDSNSNNSSIQVRDIVKSSTKELTPNDDILKSNSTRHQLETQNKDQSVIAIPSYYNTKVINTAKYAEQIQKRKLLWSNKKTENVANKWRTAKFSEDTDGKVTSKFMRLMGLKDTPNTEQSSSTTTSNNESIKKREEMFSSMEQQYEVARQVTHTMRGVGLGFGSIQRQL